VTRRPGKTRISACHAGLRLKNKPIGMHCSGRVGGEKGDY
jgi:hypothetical protein